MYKCLNCDEVFEEPASVRETHGFTDGFAETFYMCPYCNGDYEEAKQCKECDEWHTENELYSGWCEKCLLETINYDTFFEYCEANKPDQYLDTFVMYELLNCEYVPMFSSLEFHDLMVQVYNERVEQIKRDKAMFGKTYAEIIDACIRFIMDDDGSIGRENYADWLNKREVK